MLPKGLLLVLGLCVAAMSAATTTTGSSPPANVRLSGHVLAVIGDATPLAATPDKDEQITLTVVLRRDRQGDFERYFHSLYQPGSSHYRQFLTQLEIADQFGPSPAIYDRVATYLRDHGFEIIEQSTNRLTLSARGSRVAVEHAFDIGIHDYQLGGRTFYANDAEPGWPGDLAPHIQAVTGLNNLARPESAIAEAVNNYNDCQKKQSQITVAGVQTSGNGFGCFTKLLSDLGKALSGNAPGSNSDPAPLDWVLLDGAGQKVALLEFDTFQMSDVENYLQLAGVPAERIDQLSRVAVNGGATPGPDQAEVLLDINAILMVAPGAEVVVYDAPFSGAGSFQALFNAAINGGATVISNSWTYCESQTTLADVQSIDSILQSAGAAGISVFNASGDSGSTCLDGSPDTVGVPAGSPNATAVGGTSAPLGPGFTYGGESWWDGSGQFPPTGQGGFGESRFFDRPAYQDGFTSADKRSVPDVVASADPNQGVVICQASGGGCPTGLFYGGTSVAAPLWAAFTAILNQGQGQNLGFLNPVLYQYAHTEAFHSPASMGSDFAHVGLGSANLNALHLRILGEQPGLSHPATSEVGYFRSDGPPGDSESIVQADGADKAYIVVRLRDFPTNTVPGKTVLLEGNPGSQAMISPPSGVSSMDNGAVIFEVTNLVAETVTFTATDISDGTVLDQTATVEFGVPSAASASISAFPTTVNADGASSTAISIALLDSLGRPTPDKEIRLKQGAGHSVIVGPASGVTDSNGEIQFTATNLVNETVTYTAVDVSDGNLPIPGSAQVTFTNGSGVACGQNEPLPTGLNGYTVSPFATGFNAAPLFYGNINFGGCSGISSPAFVDDAVVVPSFLNGDLFRLGNSGGAVSSADKLATLGPTLSWPVIGQDGSLYALRLATNNGNPGFTTGAALELDPDTGAVIRTVAANLKCPHSLVVDPLSGDLFFDDLCFGAGSDDPNIYRIRNPQDANPAVEVYATLPGTPNGQMVFSPNGTLYAVSVYTQASPPVYMISGTDQPSPPAVTQLAGVFSNYWLNIAQSDSSGEAQMLITLADGKLKLTDITTATPTTAVELSENIGGGIVGPDGCLYMPAAKILYRLTDPQGGCGFMPTSVAPLLTLTPALVTPDPQQGDSLEFTAQLSNLAAPEGTAVYFTASGANTVFQLARTDAVGKAAFTYTGQFAGEDKVVATTTIGDTNLRSNTTGISWLAGRHISYLAIGQSPRSGTVGVPVSISATLVDISIESPEPIVGKSVRFELNSGSGCTTTSGPMGVAQCEITPATVGPGLLTATFDGTDEHSAVEDSVGFNVLEEPVIEPPPATPCDVDGNEQIDSRDIQAITAARNTPASGPDDPRDADGNGKINVLDARQCVQQCTKSRCAI